MTRIICTTIKEEDYLWAKKNLIHWNQIMKIGIMRMRSVQENNETGTPTSRIDEIEKRNDWLLKKVEFQSGRINTLDNILRTHLPNLEIPKEKPFEAPTDEIENELATVEPKKEDSFGMPV